MSKACRTVTAEEAALFLRQNDNFVILTHSSPDGDTLGSAFGLKEILEEIGKRASVVCGDAIPRKYDYLGKAVSADEIPENRTVIAVDVADPKLTSGIAEELCRECGLCIDHHPTNIRYAERLLSDGDAGAASEVVFEVAKELGVIPSKSIATALYTGIATDTGCFKYGNTRPETHIAAAELMRLGADFKFVNRLFFETVTKGRLFLEKKAYENMTFYADGVLAITVLDHETLSSPEADISELDGVAAIPRTIEGVSVGITVKEREKGVFKASVRTFPPYDAAEICAALGGGGHKCAAGCRMEGTRESAVDAVLRSALAEIERCGRHE